MNLSVKDDYRVIVDSLSDYCLVRALAVNWERICPEKRTLELLFIDINLLPLRSVACIDLGLI